MATRKAAKKTAKSKPSARMKKAVADIAQLLKTQKKLDLELKKVTAHLKAMEIHQYFQGKG
jgi:hypothetical protein